MAAGTAFRVPGVVADPANHGGAIRAETRHLPAGGFHEPVNRDGEALVRERVDLLDLVASESG